MKTGEHYHFVTGRLAEASVRHVVSELARENSFSYSLQVMPITVAALMTGRWMLRHLQLPAGATRLFLPGYLERELTDIQSALADQSPDLHIECGPKNILDLPGRFGRRDIRSDDYGQYGIEIIAEINHADQLPVEQLLQQSRELIQAGADMIDLGCTPGTTWRQIGTAVRELRSINARVAVDSFNPDEVVQASESGAELVLSVNSSNWQLAADWGCQVVAIPDAPDDLQSLFRTAEALDKIGVPFRLDPILQPLGMGLADSLTNYATCRRHFPSTPMMMGIGNLTELTDADSAGINVMLMGICQELGVGSVLTTQVINWARSSVKECDLARRLVFYANRKSVPPKHIEPELVVLRDPVVREFTRDAIAKIGAELKDRNFRLFVSGGQIHAVTKGLHVSGEDPFEVMQQILDSSSGENVDAGHAFYLGFEMCKAFQALILSKNYEQDEGLRWGYLSRPERHWRLKT